MTAIKSNEYHLIGCYIALNGLKWKDDRMSLGTEYQERTDVSSGGLIVYAKSLTRNSGVLGCFFLNKKYESWGDDIEHQIKPNCTSNLK